MKAGAITCHQCTLYGPPCITRICSAVFYTLDCIGPATPASVYSYHTPVAAGEVLIPADAVHMAILFKYKTLDDNTEDPQAAT